MHMTTRNSVEHLVIGGGLAGAMAATRLAAAGREVVLLEKEREAHHKVCGEFLSREAIHYLRQAEIEPLHLGAHAIQRVRLHSGRQAVEARLPFTALSLSRRILDETLLVKAQDAGCEVRRSAFVDKLEATVDGWSVRLRSGETMRTKTVFLGTGKHDVNAWERGGATQPDLVGFKMHWKLAPEQSEILGGVMELFLFRGGYGGLSMIEGGTANLCLVIRRSTLRRLGGWSELLQSIRNELPALRERLQNAMPCWQKPLAISPIPYGHLGGPADGVWRVGDQVAVIPSFTGDGMSIALHSAILATDMYLNGKTADAYMRCLTNQLRPGMRFATGLSRAMVTPAARTISPFLLSLMPSAMGRIALSTRIPDRSLLTTRITPGLPIDRRPTPIT
jgi:flavin-dependent dehydrogenase